MIKGSSLQEAVTIVSKYALRIGASKYIKQMLPDLKGEMEK